MANPTTDQAQPNRHRTLVALMSRGAVADARRHPGLTWRQRRRPVCRGVSLTSRNAVGSVSHLDHDGRAVMITSVAGAAVGVDDETAEVAVVD